MLNIIKEGNLGGLFSPKAVSIKSIDSEKRLFSISLKSQIEDQNEKYHNF